MGHDAVLENAEVYTYLVLACQDHSRVQLYGLALQIMT
jgi:hypothetical protein